MRLTNTQKQFLIRAQSRYSKAIELAQGYLESRGLTLEDANKFHLGVVDEPYPGHEQYKGRLSIPYQTPYGLVDIRFRSLDNSEPKYLGLLGAETTLFNVLALSKATNYICVCEGEIDTITMTCRTAHPTIGAPGATAWKNYYNKILEDYETVVVLADGDEAGLEFGKRIQRTLSNTRIVQMPEGEDVNSIVNKYGTQLINEKITSVLES
jgi:DNA primase